MKLKKHITIIIFFITLFFLYWLYTNNTHQNDAPFQKNNTISHKKIKSQVKQDNELTKTDDLSECPSLDNIISLSNIEKAKASIIEMLISLDSKNTPKKVIDEILRRSGVGLYHGYPFLRKNIDAFHVSDVSLKKYKKISFNTTEKITDIIKNKNIDAFLDLFEQGTIDSNQTILLNSDLFTPLQLLFEMKGNKINLFNLVSRLINANAKVTFSDLMFYTLHSDNTDIISLLSQYFEGDENTNFFYKDRLHNLTSLAITTEDIKKVKFWLSEGVKPSPFKYRDNALDFAANNHIENKYEIITLLLDNNVIPNNSRSYQNIIKVLDDSYITSHKTVLNNSNFTFFTNVEKQIISNFVNAIFTSTLKNIPSSITCIASSQEKQKIVKRIFSNNKNSFSPDISIKENDFLTNKVDNYLKEKELSYDTTENQEQQKPNQNEIARINRIKNLLSDGDWKSVLKENITAGYINDDNKLQASFILALMAGAPSDELIELIENGAKVDERLINLIIKKCDISVIYSLYDNGYNLNYEYPNGTNAIFAAVSNKKIKILNFLIKIGIKINVSKYSPSISPLSKAIMSLQFAPQYRKIIDILLLSDAKISTFDKEFVSSRAQYSPIYKKLVIDYPELKL